MQPDLCRRLTVENLQIRPVALQPCIGLNLGVRKIEVPDSAEERGLIQEEFGASLAQLLQQLPPSWRCSDEVEGSGGGWGPHREGLQRRGHCPGTFPLGLGLRNSTYERSGLS